MELGMHEDDVGRGLQIVDPFYSHQITFSKCVTAFSAVRLTQELVPSADNEDWVAEAEQC